MKRVSLNMKFLYTQSIHLNNEKAGKKKVIDDLNDHLNELSSELEGVKTEIVEQNSLIKSLCQGNKSMRRKPQSSRDEANSWRRKGQKSDQIKDQLSDYAELIKKEVVNAIVCRISLI